MCSTIDEGSCMELRFYPQCKALHFFYSYHTFRIGQMIAFVKKRSSMRWISCRNVFVRLGEGLSNTASLSPSQAEIFFSSCALTLKTDLLLSASRNPRWHRSILRVTTIIGGQLSVSAGVILGSQKAWIFDLRTFHSIEAFNCIFVLHSRLTVLWEDGHSRTSSDRQEV